MSSTGRAAALGAALIALGAAVFTLRTMQNGEAQLAASEAALAAGEPERAIRDARHAASAYVPGAAHVDAAYAQLQAIALAAERDGDRQLAASAWRALRTSALESAHLWQPHAARLRLANQHLARSEGSLGPAGLEPLGSGGAPRLLLGLGFLGAVAALCWFCSCAWSEIGRWQWARAAWPALGWCLGVLVLGWALLHA